MHTWRDGVPHAAIMHRVPNRFCRNGDGVGGYLRHHAGSSCDESPAPDWFISIFMALSWATLVGFGVVYSGRSRGPIVSEAWQSGARSAVDVIHALSSYLAEVPMAGKGLL
jgi:hypothetical protein